MCQTLAACDQSHHGSGPAAGHSGEVCVGGSSADRSQRERRQTLDLTPFPPGPRHLWVDVQAHGVRTRSHHTNETLLFQIVCRHKSDCPVEWEEKSKHTQIQMTFHPKPNIGFVWQHAAVGPWVLSGSVWEGRSDSDTREKPETTKCTLLQAQLGHSTEGQTNHTTPI